MTGFRGRRAIFELMLMDEHLRELIIESRSLGQLREAARIAGLRSLHEDGWRLARAGVTSVEEFLRVARDESRNGHGGVPGEGEPAKAGGNGTS